MDTSVYELLPPRTSPFDPPDQLGELRAREPVARVSLWDGRTAWLITRHADACEVLRDQKTFSADSTNPGFPSLSPGRPVPIVNRSFSRMDEPTHGEIRQMVAHEFTAARVERLLPRIREVVDERLDTMLAAGPPADLMSAFAQPVAALVLSDLVGVPREDAMFLQERALTMVSRTRVAGQTGTAQTEMFAYFDRLLTRAERTPGTDLIGQLVATQQRDGRMSRDDLNILVQTIIVAGYENPANMIGLGVLSILLDPEGARVARAGPEDVAHAVEELLRYHTVASQDGVPRVATADAVVGGVRIREGDAVIVSLSSANRDESVFATPNQLDYGRDTHRHLAFGHGVHMCLGRHLARAELTTALTAAVTRVPMLRLAVPLEEVPFREDMHTYGLHELPVTW